MLPEEEKDPMHATVDFRLDGQKQPTLFGQSDRNSPQSDPADEPQPPTLDPTVIAAPLGNPPEEPFATLFEDPLEDLSESPFDSHLEAPPPFRIPSEHAACPESFRSRLEALPSAPFEAFAGTFFGVFRRRPRAPSANDASPSGSPRVIIPGSPRMRHVSPEAPSAPQASR